MNAHLNRFCLHVRFVHSRILLDFEGQQMNVSVAKIIVSKVKYNVSYTHVCIKLLL